MIKQQSQKEKSREVKKKRSNKSTLERKKKEMSD